MFKDSLLAFSHSVTLPSSRISNTLFDFGFGTKRHMVEPLAVSHVVYKYRQIKLMARVQ